MQNYVVIKCVFVNNKREFMTGAYSAQSLQPVFTEKMEIELQVTRAEPWE